MRLPGKHDGKLSCLAWLHLAKGAVRFLEGGGGSMTSFSGDPRKPRTVGNPVYERNRMKIIAQALG